MFVNDAAFESLKSAWIDTFRKQKQTMEDAVAQLSDDELHRSVAPGVNSVAIIMNHVAGSMRSRWTDFWTTDGEKPDRDRDSEFAARDEPRDAMMARWNAAWATLLGVIEAMQPEDLRRSVTIRGEVHTVPLAICRAMEHYGYHRGQVLMLARVVKGADWKWLTIAPGKTGEFNRAMREKHG
jgi:uncharacterized damage-inducible protein DinB